ncbi:transposase [Kitasatospora sp. NPDC008115]|uniref:transposase n=1 Tax=Kitasatospora sp. NPDC008115 TaxID=3364022 RepID=UPI0036EF8219
MRTPGSRDSVTGLSIWSAISTGETISHAKSGRGRAHDPDGSQYSVKGTAWDSAISRWRGHWGAASAGSFSAPVNSRVVTPLGRHGALGLRGHTRAVGSECGLLEGGLAEESARPPGRTEPFPRSRKSAWPTSYSAPCRVRAGGRAGRGGVADCGWAFRSDHRIVGPVVPLSDAQWARMEPLLPDRTPKQGGRRRDHRQVINAIAFTFQTGTPR